MGVILRQRGLLRERFKHLRRWWRRWRADVHIVSFPKCGRTWLVLLIAKAIESHYGITRRKPLKIRGYHSRRLKIPYIHAHHDGGPEFLLPEELGRDKSFYKTRKVIFLVRDPRDVLVSSYFQKTKRNYNFQGDMGDYVRERRGGIESIVEFYNIWVRNAGVPRDFLQITYEDLHADTEVHLRRALDFIGCSDVSDEDIARSVDYCRFDNMRDLESSNAFQTGALSARDPEDQQTYKTRKGEVGGYISELFADDLAFVEGIIDAQLSDAFAQYKRGARPQSGQSDPTTPAA